MLLPGRHRISLCSAARRSDLKPDCNKHGDHDEFANSDFFSNPDRDGHAYANSNRNKDPDTDHLGYAVHTADVHVHGFPDLYGLAYLHADAKPYPFTDGYQDANAYAIADRNTDTYAYAFPHAMTDIVPFLKSLISAAGLSAYEAPVAQLIEERWKPLVDEVSTSRLGSLHGLKKGSAKGKRPSLMVATHMDAIGLMVSQITDGFLHVDEIGGIDPRILPGTPVVVHGKRDLPGVVAMPPMKTLMEQGRQDTVALSNLLIDVGLTPAQVARNVRVGDIVSFDTKPMDMAGETLSGHSLDNRASVAALTVCLEDLQGKSHAWDVWAVATAQEEETLGGGATSAFHLQPDLAVVIDVTFARGPGASGWQTFGMGKGPTLGWGANLHPFLYERCKDLAERLEIPVSIDLTPAHSGTDAHAIQVARDGIPTLLIGIPLRYMHTPVEMIAIKDVMRAGRLLAEFICGLEPDFVSEIVWEDISAD